VNGTSTLMRTLVGLNFSTVLFTLVLLMILGGSGSSYALQSG
jgi:hypothetical protein